MMKYDVVIVAYGKGERASLGFNKVFFTMKDGMTVLDHSLVLFLKDEDCHKIIVVTNEEYRDLLPIDDKIFRTDGGERRQDSVRNGLAYVESPYVFIHDGARPFLQEDNLEALKEKLQECDAVVLGHKAVDTIKVLEDDRIIKTVDRNTIFIAETPQAFKTDLLKDCYSRCEDILFTDDASLVESLGYEVKAVFNPHDNRKLTGSDDFKDL
ncbi:MAG: 2-C-methyl-D-erythritol 4-phosphate cytidylyltransferase [Erysipelotrichaceae bacterium]|nr:2-C-methyl-D-erythritol 4-phosphate cytidylyltransferase [Erysipelotrichaceae bacterium]